MIEITAIHLVGGVQHEHIAEIRWRNAADSSTGASSTVTTVEWLRVPANSAYVASGGASVAVGVVEASRPYIRTYADRVWTDNLLSLPRY